MYLVFTFWVLVAEVSQVLILRTIFFEFQLTIQGWQIHEQRSPML